MQHSCCGSRQFPRIKLSQVSGYLFSEPIRCFLKSYHTTKGGQNTENISRNKVNENSQESLLQELEGYEEQKVALFLNGRPSCVKSIARACNIADGEGYMRDYTEDEHGRITQVNFAFIDEDV